MSEIPATLLLVCLKFRDLIFHEETGVKDSKDHFTSVMYLFVF